jgi:uncharacterized protein involved in tellurium resistance
MPKTQTIRTPKATPTTYADLAKEFRRLTCLIATVKKSNQTIRSERQRDKFFDALDDARDAVHAIEEHVCWNACDFSVTRNRAAK